MVKRPRRLMRLERRAKPEKRIRVRSKNRKPIDETKLALAFWLMAMREIEERDAGEEEKGEEKL